MNTRRIRPATKRSSRAWHLLVGGLALTIVITAALATKTSRVQAANGCQATTSIGTTYGAPASEAFGSKVQDANIISLTDANPAFSQWTSGNFHYQVYRFAVQSEGDLNLNGGTLDVNPGAGYPTISCTDTVDPTTGEIPWTNAANQTIYPVGVQLGVPNMGAANNNGLWETGALSGGATPPALDGPAAPSPGPVYQNDQQSAAAVVDDAGGAAINGQTLWCQALDSSGYTPTCPVDIRNYAPTDKSDPMDLPGAGFMFTAPDCHTTGTAGNGNNNSLLKCGPSDFDWYGNTNTDLVSDGFVQANGVNPNGQTGVITPFSLSMSAENTHAFGFQAAMFLTFKYPTTLAPSVTVSADCTNKQLNYTIINTSATGSAEGLVNGASIGNLPVPPYTNSFSIPAPNPSGSFQVIVTLNTLVGAQVVQSTNLAYDCTGGSGGTAPPPGTAACTFPVTETPSLPWDPGEQASITASVDFTPPTPTFVDTGNGGFVETYLSTAATPGHAPYHTDIVEPPWAAKTGPDDQTTVTWTGTVPNDPGPFDVSWQFTWYLETHDHIPIPHVGGSLKLGFFVYYTYQDVYSVSAPNVVPAPPCTQPGTGPAGSSGGLPTGSTPSTTGTPSPQQEIVDKPYVRIYGGDVVAGGNFAAADGTCAAGPTANIYGWSKEAATGLTPSSMNTNWIGGAGTQFDAEASGKINAFASATNTNTGGAANNPAPPTGLSISNLVNINVAAPNENYGGGFTGGVDCQTDYWDNQPPASSLQTLTGDQASLSGGTFSWNGGGNLGTAGKTIMLQPGTQTVIYATGNVDILSNIQFGSGGVGAAENIPVNPPTFTLIDDGGTITIDHSVTGIDGIYVAQGGTINTCDTATNNQGYYDACISPLAVNGSLVASKVNFGRTANTVNDSCPAYNTTDICDAETSSNTAAAEIINFSPLVWMQTQTALSQSYDAISSLPPVSP